MLVLNPDARLTAILTGPFSADTLQTDFQHIVAAPARSPGAHEPRLWCVASIPAAAARAVAAGAGGDPGAHAMVQELDHPRFPQALPGRHGSRPPRPTPTAMAASTNSLPAPSRRVHVRSHATSVRSPVPADGCVSEAGSIDGDRLLQAKGRLLPAGGAARGATLGEPLRRRLVRDNLSRALQLSPRAHAAAR